MGKKIRLTREAQMIALSILKELEIQGRKERALAAQALAAQQKQQTEKTND